MAHIFKPGDRAYSLIKNEWIELVEFRSKDYPLVRKGSETTFTKEGKYACNDLSVALLPINPYDPTDPNNPPEFKSEWPFMLNGRPVNIGDELIHCGESGKPFHGKVYALEIIGRKLTVFLRSGFGGDTGYNLDDAGLRWPDEIPTKKKVAKWAYAVIGNPGRLLVEFTEEMTEEEAKKIYGASIRMIPGTEREVEE